MAPAHDLVVRSISAGAALHARPRSKVASEACARRRVRKLGAALIISESIAEIIERNYAYDLHPIRCQYGAHLHGRRACDGIGELRSTDRDPRASRKNARRILCSRRTGDTLDVGQPPGPTLLNWSPAGWPHGSEETRGVGQSLCAPTQLSGSFRAQPAQSPPGISQSLRGTGIAPVALLAQIKPIHAERRHCLGARTAASSELPQASYEKAIGFGC